jgi:hypothetical protein
MDEMEDLPDLTVEAIASLAGVPQECFPEWGVVIIGYLDQDGESKFETRMVGEQRATTMMGVLELMKHELILVSLEEYIYDEDDEGD